MRSLFCALAALLVAVAPAAAQRTIRDHRFALDAKLAGASLSYAHRVDGDWFGGVGLGAGGDFVNWMVVGGRHFGEGGWIAYEERDAAGGELVFEMAHVSAFARYEPGERWQADVGFRGAAFLHFDDSDDDPGGGLFVGPYAAIYWGWRHVKVGPRVMAGLFSEGSGAREFGVNVAPLTVRITFP